jgi:hypothetical protein
MSPRGIGSLRAAISACLLLAVLVLPAACGPGSPTPTPAGDATPTGAPASTPVATPGAGGTFTPRVPLITYGVSGGIAGFRRVLTISPTGEVRLTDKGEELGTLQLDAADLGRLRELVRAADFYNLKDSYNQGNVADDIFKTITYSEGEQAKTVSVATVGGQGLTPPALLALIAALDEIEHKVQSPTSRVKSLRSIARG